MGYGRNTENLYYKDKLGQHWHSRQKPAVYPPTQYMCPVNAQKNFFRATYPGHFQQVGYPGLVSRPIAPTPRYTQCLYEISPSYQFDNSVASIQKSFSSPNPGLFSVMPESFILSPAQAEVQYLPFYPCQPLASQIPASPMTWDNSVSSINYIPLPSHGKSMEEMAFVSSGLADQISSHSTPQLPVNQQESNLTALSQYSQETGNYSWQASTNVVPSLYGQDDPTQYSNRILPTSQPVGYSDHQSDPLSVISQLACEFVESFCPQLGEKPYCIPPVKRSRHPDKSNKLLVLSMESEKRVLGSFERYFGEHKMPVFMLCHYPTSGFMKAFNNQFTDRNDSSGSANSVTLMLLSSLFDITLVTVSIISGNSDFAYIQRAVLKSAAHMKRCRTAVNNWLTYLNIRLEVREVLAFPNLKKAMLQRIAKDKSFKHMYGNLVTLHVDDLSAPFEEEWSTPVHKHQFTEWIKSKVLCHTSSVLSRDQLQLLVGALLSPRLSTVEYMKNLDYMNPISNAARRNDPTKEMSEDLSQLKLTIDGVTKTFDEFMDEYVLSYYPEVDSKSYRVPPIHFNIQSLKKPTEYLKDPWLQHGKFDSETDIDKPDKDFMPRHTSYKYYVKKSRKEDQCCEVIKMSGQVPYANSSNNPVRSPVQSSGKDDNNIRFSSVQIVDHTVIKECHVPLNEMLKGVEVFSDVMKKDTRADEGENRVISSLEYIASDPHHKPMFIICGYQYNNYLNKLREEMFSKGEANRPVRAFGQTMRAEHDCLIFHKKYGAIIVCIKAIGDNFSDWNASLTERMDSTNKILKKAVKQLEREEAMIHHVTSDLCPGLKCHRLIALPNMKREDVHDAIEKDPELKKNISQLTNGHGVDMFLCQDELSTKFTSIWDQPKEVKSRLMSWWNDVVDNLLTDTKHNDSTENSLEKEIMTSKVYRQIIGRYCGLLSTVEVWSPNNPRVEVRSDSEAANVCAKRFAKLVLLPHQVEVLCSDYRRLFLYGPPGSGKTLLLILKAREWLLSNRTVIILNARPGSSYGYPYAYGVCEKLKKMLEPHKYLEKNVYLCNIDSLHFKPEDLAQVLPTTCIIMDEVTPSSHPIIEHLCCLQVQYIWCAGGFLEDRPITARGFHTCQMDKILRCPPIVQTLLKHTEGEVRFSKPYQQIYQSTSFQLSKSSDKKTENNICSIDVSKQLSELFKSSNESKFQEKNNSTMTPADKENVGSCEKFDSIAISYDAESLNKRLMAKYSNKSKQQSNLPDVLEKTNVRNTEGQNLSWYTTSSVELGLATDGPRPHIIDHQGHSNEPKYPQDCHQCAEDLAKFLQSLVRESGFFATLAQRHQPSKNKYAFKAMTSSNKNKMSKPGELTLYSNVSSIYSKASPPRASSNFNSKALLWTDVLMVVQDIDPDCTFLTTLTRRGIPIELAIGEDARKIEQPSVQKLYVTTYKEVSGLERTLVVFVPSEIPSQPDNQQHSLDLQDLQLSQCIQRYTDKDRIALWHVASRSLSSLVLILP